MQIFCNSMVWEGLSEELVFVGARCPTRSFYIMKREELEEWFSCLSRENWAICSYCDSPDCYTCARFKYIKNELHKHGYFVDRNWPWQLVTREIHVKFFSQTTSFQFAVHIDRAVRCNFLIRKYCFVNC